VLLIAQLLTIPDKAYPSAGPYARVAIAAGLQKEVPQDYNQKIPRSYFGLVRKHLSAA
jgi:hypothetical protein